MPESTFSLETFDHCRVVSLTQGLILSCAMIVDFTFCA